MNSENEENENYIIYDLKYAFFNKAKYQKALILFVPSMVYFIFGVLILIIYFSIVNNDNFLKNYLVYICDFFKSVFGEDHLRTNFVIYTKKLSESNIILFTFLIFSTILFFWSLFYNYDSYKNLINLNTKNPSKLFHLISFFIFIFVILIFKLLLNYYRILEILHFILNCLFGIILLGIILHFLIVFSIKFYFYRKNISN